MDFDQLAYWLGAVEEYDRAMAEAADGGNEP